MTADPPMGYAARPHPDGEAPVTATCKRCHRQFTSIRTAIVTRDGVQDFRSPRCPSCERAYIRGMP
jgi:NAD-dependent SIR2 family protein deacetylase